MNTSMQREVIEWFSDWFKTPVPKETALSFTRGPIRDFQMNFLVPKVRTNAYIDTIKANFYLQEEEDSDDFIEDEIHKALFEDKLNKLKELEAELSIHSARVEEKRSLLLKRDTQQAKCESMCSKQKELSSMLDQRIAKTREVIQECDKLTAEDSARPNNNIIGELAINTQTNSTKAKQGQGKVEAGKKLESLSDAAHNAFQLVVMRHYLSDGLFGLSTSPKLGNSSSDEFNSLVRQVIHEEACGLLISDWVHTERQRHIRINGDQKRKFALQEQQAAGSGLQQSMGDKMNDLVIAWSATHVSANHKNRAREKLLREAQDSLRQARENCRRQQCDSSYRLSDFLSMVRCRELGAKITRVRQYASRANLPLETMFKNVSTDYFASPVASDCCSIYLDFGQGSKVRPWIDAISDQEHIQEIYTVLQKTWNCAQRNLTDMVQYAQGPNNELLPNLVQTSELVKFTMPKPSTMAAIQQQRQQQHVARAESMISALGELQNSILSASTASIISTVHNLSQLDATCFSVESGGSVSVLSDATQETQWYDHHPHRSWEDERLDEISRLLSMQNNIGNDESSVMADTSLDIKMEEMRQFVEKYKSPESD